MKLEEWPEYEKHTESLTCSACAEEAKRHDLICHCRPYFDLKCGGIIHIRFIRDANVMGKALRVVGLLCSRCGDSYGKNASGG